MKTPDYIITEEHTHRIGPLDERILPKGSFVRPIQYCYLPAHVKNDSQWKDINLDTHVFCYTHFGIIAIERKILREV